MSLTRALVALVLASLALCVCPCLLEAQTVLPQANSMAGSMAFGRRAGPPYPIQATLPGNAPFSFDLVGTAPGAPFMICGSTRADLPGMQVTATIVCNLDMALGFELSNGFDPSVPSFTADAHLDQFGKFHFVIQIPVAGPDRLDLGIFQAAIVDPSQPDGLAVTAATFLVLTP